MALKDTGSPPPSPDRTYRARWYRRDLAAGLAVSALFHVGLFAWRESDPVNSSPIDYSTSPTLDAVSMPVYEPEPPPLDDVVTLSSAKPQIPGLPAPPTQFDYPQYITVDAFVQPISLPVPRAAKPTLATKILPGGLAGNGSLGEVFDPSALDQMAVPTIQMQPTYPETLRRLSMEGSALLEFIVDTQGRVRSPQCLKATHPDFAWAAIEGVRKWRFRPGKKAGRPVNTRLRQMILFSLQGPGN